MDKVGDVIGWTIGALFWVGIGYLIVSSLFSPDTSSSPEPVDATPSSSSYYENYDEYEYSSDYTSEETYEPSYDSYSGDMDCGDFDTWEDAQYHYENVADDNLDRDYDGVACESLQ